MSEQSYEFTGVEKVNLHGYRVKQIRAVRDIPRRGIRKGDVGGWIESSELTNGDARVSGDAWVYGNAQVYGDAQVYGNARVYGDARVYGNAQVYGNARVERHNHFMVVGPIGSENVTATLVRAKGGRHILTVGCWTGTLGTLMAEVKRRREHWSGDDAQHDVWVEQYRALKKLGKATVAQW